MAAPLLARGRVIGMMAVWRNAPAGLFTEEDLNFLVGLSQQAAIAIESARLFQASRESKQYFESLVEISPVAVVTMDRQQIVSGWNPAAARLFGYSTDDAIGRHIDALVVPEELVQEGDALVRQASDQGRSHLLSRRRKKDGGTVEVEIDMVPLVVDGERQGYYAIYHDVSELQEARRAAETLLAVTQVLGTTLSLQDTFDTILDELQRVVPYDSCSVQVIQGNRLVIVSGRGFDDLEALVGQGFDLDDETNLNSQVVRSKRTQVFADVSDNPHFASVEHGAGRIRGWICAPDDRRRSRRRRPQRRQVRAQRLRPRSCGARDGVRCSGGDRHRERPAARHRTSCSRGGRDAPRRRRVARKHTRHVRSLRPDPVGAAQGRSL